MQNKPLNSTIEIDYKNGIPARAALVFRGWYSPAREEIADGHYRCLAPDGVLWHVLSFGSDCGAELARALVHRVFDGQVKRIGIDL